MKKEGGNTFFTEIRQKGDKVNSKIPIPKTPRNKDQPEVRQSRPGHFESSGSRLKALTDGPNAGSGLGSADAGDTCAAVEAGWTCTVHVNATHNIKMQQRWCSYWLAIDSKAAELA